MSTSQDVTLIGNLRQTLNVTVDGLSDAFDLVQDLNRMTEPDTADGLPLAAFKAQIRTRLDQYSNSQNGVLQALLATLQTAQGMDNGAQSKPPERKDSHHDAQA